MKIFIKINFYPHCVLGEPLDNKTNRVLAFILLNYFYYSILSRLPTLKHTYFYLFNNYLKEGAKLTLFKYT